MSHVVSQDTPAEGGLPVGQQGRRRAATRPKPSGPHGDGAGRRGHSP